MYTTHHKSLDILASTQRHFSYTICMSMKVYALNQQPLHQFNVKVWQGGLAWLPYGNPSWAAFKCRVSRKVIWTNGCSTTIYRISSIVYIDINVRILTHLFNYFVITYLHSPKKLTCGWRDSYFCKRIPDNNICIHNTSMCIQS